MNRVRVALALFAALAACGKEDADTQRDCRDVASDFNDAMNTAAAAPGACEVDADCTLQRPVLQCADGTHVETCPVAMTDAVYDGVSARAQSLQDELCAKDCGFAVFVDCKSVHSACDMPSKTCATISD